MFAILFEVLLIENQEEIHHFAGWEGGGQGAQKLWTKILWTNGRFLFLFLSKRHFVTLLSPNNFLHPTLPYVLRAFSGNVSGLELQNITSERATTWGTRVGALYAFLNFALGIRVCIFEQNGVAKASAPYRGQNRQNREKRVSGSKNSHFPRVPEMGALSQKIPISLQGSTRKMGIFWLKAPISGTLGNGSFLTPKPSFPDFGDFDPCRGRTLSQKWCGFGFGSRRGFDVQFFQPFFPVPKSTPPQIPKSTIMSGFSCSAKLLESVWKPLIPVKESQINSVRKLGAL